MILHHYASHNSGFSHSYILNLLIFVIAFFNLLLYIDIHIDKNITYKFVGLSNLRNFFFRLIF